MNLDRREDVQAWVLLTFYSPICMLALNFQLCIVDWQVNVNDEHKAAFAKRNIQNV